MVDYLERARNIMDDYGKPIAVVMSVALIGYIGATLALNPEARKRHRDGQNEVRKQLSPSDTAPVMTRNSSIGDLVKTEK